MLNRILWPVEKALVVRLANKPGKPDGVTEDDFRKFEETLESQRQMIEIYKGIKRTGDTQ